MLLSHMVFIDVQAKAKYSDHIPVRNMQIVFRR